MPLMKLDDCGAVKSPGVFMLIVCTVKVVVVGVFMLDRLKLPYQMHS
jgi:hypothetical protein